MGTLEEEKRYYEQRAETELELAQRATDEKAVRAHYEMAGHYLDRVHRTEPDPSPEEGTEP